MRRRAIQCPLSGIRSDGSLISSVPDRHEVYGNITFGVGLRNITDPYYDFAISPRRRTDLTATRHIAQPAHSK